MTAEELTIILMVSSICAVCHAMQWLLVSLSPGSIFQYFTGAQVTKSRLLVIMLLIRL